MRMKDFAGAGRSVNSIVKFQRSPYIRDILGHADLKTTEIYARIDGEMKRKALEEAFTNTVPSEAVPLWQQDGELLNWLQSLGR